MKLAHRISTNWHAKIMTFFDDFFDDFLMILMISILVYENMHYNRSRFAGKSVDGIDGQTRHPSYPLLELFRHSPIQLQLL